MFLTIFVKKSFFFMAKKFFDAIFFVEVTKKNEKSLYQMKVGIKFGKVKKFGIGWCILHRMAADNAKGGSMRTPPPYGIGLTSAIESLIQIALTIALVFSRIFFSTLCDAFSAKSVTKERQGVQRANSHDS